MTEDHRSAMVHEACTEHSSPLDDQGTPLGVIVLLAYERNVDHTYLTYPDPLMHSSIDDVSMEIGGGGRGDIAMLKQSALHTRMKWMEERGGWKLMRSIYVCGHDTSLRRTLCSENFINVTFPGCFMR